MAALLPGHINEERSLILTPVGRDSSLIADLLKNSGTASIACRDIGQFCVEIHAGAGVGVISEEAFTPAALKCVLDELSRQPAWSELPLIVLTAPGWTSRQSTRLAEALERVANVTHLERPVRPLTLASTVRTALRARRRQYQVRDLLAVKEAAIRDSQSALQQRDEFLAMLGHELRNPLATINTSLQVMDHLNWEPEIIAEQRPVLQRQTRTLARLVDDLLDVARITSGTITLQKEAIDLSELVLRCIASMRQQFSDANITLVADVKNPAITIDADSVRIEQVVSNLLTNALKFTPAGGTVSVSLRPEHDKAALSVRDSGVGIPPAMLAQVFDLFTQAHASMDRKLGGLGLGLTIVRRIVDLHGGTVSAQSDGAGRGTEFIVHLPLVAAPITVNEPSVKRPEGCRRILLVEDNPDARMVMRRLLRLFGHEVEVAEDGPGGLNKALSARYDAVVVDIGLPGFDGYEVARRLRAHGLNKTRLIAMTGYGQRDDRERAINAGFDAHLVKPIDTVRLSQLILQSDNAGSIPE